MILSLYLQKLCYMLSIVELDLNIQTECAGDFWERGSSKIFLLHIFSPFSSFDPQQKSLFRNVLGVDL